MSKEDSIEVTGTVVEKFPSGLFSVQLDQDRTVLAHLAGKLRRNRIRVRPVADRPYARAEQQPEQGLRDHDRVERRCRPSNHHIGEGAECEQHPDEGHIDEQRPAAQPVPDHRAAIHHHA